MEKCPGRRERRAFEGEGGEDQKSRRSLGGSGRGVGGDSKEAERRGALKQKGGLEEREKGRDLRRGLADTPPLPGPASEPPAALCKYEETRRRRQRPLYLGAVCAAAGAGLGTGAGSQGAGAGRGEAGLRFGVPRGQGPDGAEGARVPQSRAAPAGYGARRCLRPGLAGAPQGAAVAEPSAPRTGVARSRARRGRRRDYGEARRNPEMSRVRRLLLGYLFPALLLHGEFGDGWLSWGVLSPPIAPPKSRAGSLSAQCTHLPFPAGAQSPFPQRRPQWFFVAAVFFLEGCEPRPDTFYLSHP